LDREEKMNKIQKINRFIKSITEKERIKLLRDLLNEDVVVSDVIEEQVNYE